MTSNRPGCRRRERRRVSFQPQHHCHH